MSGAEVGADRVNIIYGIEVKVFFFGVVCLVPEHEGIALNIQAGAEDFGGYGIFYAVVGCCSGCEGVFSVDFDLFIEVSVDICPVCGGIYFFDVGVIHCAY